MMRVALLLLSVANVGVFGPLHTAFAACDCTGAGGGKCSGDCCKKLSSGECECWDKVNGKCNS